MISRSWMVALLLAAACTGGGTGGSAPAAPASSAENAVMTFLDAVADSNVQRMAELWGTDRGPAAETKQPSDYERRLTIVQTYLRNATYKIIGNTPPPSEPTRQPGESTAPPIALDPSRHRLITVELSRPQCTRTVPFMTVRTASGAWIVRSVDLERAGNPIKACEQAADSTGS